MTSTAFFTTTTKKQAMSAGCIISFMLFALLTSSSPAQTPAVQSSLAEKLQAMTKSSALTDVVTRPWHLKLAVTLFDVEGKNPQEGTVEVWQSGKNRRSVFQFGSASLTSLINEGKSYRTGTGDPVPELASAVLKGFLSPGPDEFDFDGATPELRPQKFGKQDFDCIMLSSRIPDVRKAPLGLFPTYCGLSGTSDLRVIFADGVQVFLRKQIGTFSEHRVTTQLEVSEGAITVAQAKVESLTSFVPKPNEFEPDAGTEAVTGQVARIAGGVISGAKIGGQVPTYPVNARMNHVSGRVVLHAIIGTDGHIHSLRVISTGDADLAVAALVAVRTWRYKPYLLNGVPTTVDTTVTVNFNLN